MAQWGGGGGCGTAVSRCSVSAKITGHVALVPAAQHVRVLSSHGGALSMRHAQQGIGGSAVSGVGAGGQGLSKCLGVLHGVVSGVLGVVCWYIPAWGQQGVSWCGDMAPTSRVNVVAT